MIKISVILVHFNAQKLINQAIQSLWEQKIEAEWEFLISDNSQNFDDSLLCEKNIPFHLIDLKYNAGFARGVNQGLQKVSGNIILIVNQDAFLTETDFLQKAFDKLFSLPKKTILGCQLKDLEGQNQQSIWMEDPGILKEWRRGPINCKFHPKWQENLEAKTALAHQRNGYVHRINAAFLLLQTPENRDKILFDEDFFLYGEDVEWAMRLKKLNWKFYHFADVEVSHVGSASSLNLKLKLRQIELMDWLFIRKYHGKIYFWFFIQLRLFNAKLTSYLIRRTKEKNAIEINNKERRELQELLDRHYALILRLDPHTNFFDLLNCYKNA